MQTYAQPHSHTHALRNHPNTDKLRKISTKMSSACDLSPLHLHIDYCFCVLYLHSNHVRNGWNLRVNRAERDEEREAEKEFSIHVIVAMECNSRGQCVSQSSENYT